METRKTQRKGDLAVAQAVATFTRFGCDVSLPLTESAAYDMIVDKDGKLYRVQVRFSSDKEVGLRKIHSNSKGYVVKILKKNAFDWLYVLSGSGTEFLITRDLAGMRSVTPQPRDDINHMFSKKNLTKGG
jgi:hypothetical protein